jgi:hypothetical protein
MMDDWIKVYRINETYKTLSCDWVLNVDADEYAFVSNEQIAQNTTDVLKVKFIDVYRHVTESDLDVNRPIKEQRRHGKFHSERPDFNKPIIARTGLELKWEPGNHYCNLESIDVGIIGAHWRSADISFCLTRKLKHRRDRQSKNNKAVGMCTQYWDITEASVKADCLAHSHDPQVF